MPTRRPTSRPRAHSRPETPPEWRKTHYFLDVMGLTDTKSVSTEGRNGVAGGPRRGSRGAGAPFMLHFRNR